MVAHNFDFFQVELSGMEEVHRSVKVNFFVALPAA